MSLDDIISDYRDVLKYDLVIDYAKSHHFGFWHKYVEGVNMTSIECKNGSPITLPKYDNSFYLSTYPKAVSQALNFENLFKKLFEF